MTLTTYTPFDVDAWLRDAVQTAAGRSAWTPACNVYENDHGFWIEAALPGIERTAIEITLEDGVLTLKGERKESDADATRLYVAREIGSGIFERSFRVPANVDPSKVAASFKEGVLTVELPKREETKPRRITIETA
jgi:HSP20 family protein